VKLKIIITKTFGCKASYENFGSMKLLSQNHQHTKKFSTQNIRFLVNIYTAKIEYNEHGYNEFTAIMNLFQSTPIKCSHISSST
jgi:hypothetical protein